VFPEFGHPIPGYVVKDGDHEVLVQMKLMGDDGWSDLLRFVLRVKGPADLRGRYTGYDNTPPYRDPERERAAADHLNRLLWRLAADPLTGFTPSDSPPADDPIEPRT
jgi:hypothetical protein